MIKAILFDMDGTLIDSSEGIINCVLYALERFGLKEDNPDRIRTFIGPPLVSSFQRQYGFSEEDAKKASPSWATAVVLCDPRSTKPL